MLLTCCRDLLQDFFVDHVDDRWVKINKIDAIVDRANRTDFLDLVLKHTESVVVVVAEGCVHEDVLEERE